MLSPRPLRSCRTAVHPPRLARRGVSLLCALLLGAGALLFAGCGKSSSDAHPMGNGAAAASFDQQFIDMMTPHHEGAVMMAGTAQQRAQHPELKALAGEMVAAQKREITDLKGWRKQWFGSDETPSMDKMPMLPGMSHAPMMEMSKEDAKLKTADPFDKAFIDAMIPHHQSAIEAAKTALQKGEHAEIKTLAASIIASQQREIEQLEAWRTQWYP